MTRNEGFITTEMFNWTPSGMANTISATFYPFYGRGT
jgi:hypothetical protein